MDVDFVTVYEKWTRRELTQAQAADVLGMSERTFRRRTVRYRAEGLTGLDDRRVVRGATPSEIAALKDLYATEYPSWQLLPFYRKYKEDHGGNRSYAWVRKHLQLAGLVPKRSRKASQELVEGLLLNQAIWRYQWVPGEAWDLVVTSDNATGRVYSGFFVDRHTVWASFRGIREVLTTRGYFFAVSVPWAPDRRRKLGLAQFGRVMEDFLIEVVQTCPSSVSMQHNQVFGTLRWVLPQHLARAKATTRNDANAYLCRYWTTFNEAFAVECKDDVFDPLNPCSLATLDDYLCLTESAIVGCDNRVRYAGRDLQIPERDGERRVSYQGQEVEIREFEDGSLAIVSGGKEVLGRLSPDPAIQG